MSRQRRTAAARDVVRQSARRRCRRAGQALLALVLLALPLLSACAAATQPSALSAPDEEAMRVSPSPNVPGPTPTVAATATPATPATPEVLADGLINLTHLNYLSEEVRLDNEPVLLTHIYAEAPSYAWVDAAGEGIACVDDVARAAIVYLDFYTATGNRRALERARAALNFVLRMQAEDGHFYNFVLDRQGTINTSGATSYRSLGWWAFRGLWALARGYAVWRPIDPAYAQRLQTAYLTTERALAARLTNVGRYGEVHGWRLPAWLPDGAADATGVAVLALAEYQAVAPNPETERLLTALADGLRDAQLGGAGTYPWSMHPSSINAPGFWHAWGAHQAQALARAGQVLGRADYIASARREVEHFFAWQIATERIQEIGVLPFRQGQQAYGTNSLVQAAINLYHATGEQRYAVLGGLLASWFFGNNMAATPMYDPATGRGYDGIDRELAVNFNAGAESTIEALMALQAVMPIPDAARYLQAQPVTSLSWRVFDAGDAQELAGTPTYGRRGWTGEARFFNERYYELDGDDLIELPIDVPADGAYLLYVSHLRRAAAPSGREVVAPRVGPAPTIDGRADEWRAVPAIASATPAQILRGAESWRGAEVDSFTLRAQWDEQFLYLLAEVRDPQHQQSGQGPAVGTGDALWLYLDGEGTGRRLSAKVTLAQTPGGPEVWDWKAGFPLPGAQLAWTTAAGGYTYEAALPWESLRVRGVQAGTTMRIEAGRSFGGNSFMDLSGADPDSAANLVPLRLVDQAQPAAAPTATDVPTGDAQRVALAVQLDDGTPWIVPQALAPDRDYLWLDLLTPQPIHLTQGRHTLRLRFAGSDPDAAAIVDGFLLHPAVATKTLRLPDGSELHLRFDMLQGQLTIDE